MFFKKTLIVFAIISSIILTGCQPKEQFTFTIKGNIANFESPEVIVSEFDYLAKKTTPIDTLIVTGGTFEKGFNLNPGIYTIALGAKTVTLVAGKGQTIEIIGDIDDVTVKGSTDTQLLADYEAFRKTSLDKLVTSVRNKIKELKKHQTSESETEIATLRQLEIKNYDVHLDELIQFVKDSMGTSLAVYPTALRWRGGENLPFLKDLVARFKTAHPNSNLSEKLANRFQQIENRSVGSSFSNISMPNANNEIIELNKVKATYTLIDVWASWCPPCRSESGILVDLYQKFKPRGFEIYGISLDSRKNNWLKAMEKDRRIWPNVSTVQGFKTPFALDYGITALPTNFIIDSNGKIIAVNIHGEELKEKIMELFE